MEYIAQIGFHIGWGAAEFNMPAYLTIMFSIGRNSVL